MKSTKMSLNINSRYLTDGVYSSMRVMIYIKGGMVISETVILLFRGFMSGRLKAGMLMESILIRSGM